ncbi:MAG TPA: 1-(5-phosphoribosyl)-5-((5-phosphoribosylamino)methylideneamino)imidazole-4-carboxamide isomerase [Bacteroidetes bacterium]|nr:1-(5-phosphoribosyl)-5-((5-phosphoribosylamino)methylideneamino)imidazole-4-carboxamide isomerase [Bacteroidota bacterium]
MLLIFPSIEIRRGSCVQLVHGDAGSEHIYAVDPVQMAVIWRGENAKTLHVVDIDGVETGSVQNIETIQRMVQAVDIPIQVGGGLRDFDEIERVLSMGVYRVVIGTAAVNRPSFVERLIKDFGTRRIAIAIEGRDGRIRTEGGKKELDLSPLTLAKEMKRIGVARIVYSDIGEDGRTKRLNLEALKNLAVGSGVRITAQGGVREYKDLIRLQELERVGVDSVIVGRALYENHFPCQRLWRLNEKELTSLGPTRRV